MTRLGRIALAATVLVAALSAQRLALPGGTVACSCAAPGPLAPVFTGEEEAVFVGRAGQPDARGAFSFTVELWFKGGEAPVVAVNSEKQFFADGSWVINTCGLHFEVGDHLIMAASWVEGTLTPAICSPHAVVESALGQELLGAAARTFGEGRPPGAPPTTGPAGEAGIDLALVALVVVGAIVLLSLVTIVVAVARRGTPAEPRP